MNILIVDDDPLISRLLRRQLEDLGYTYVDTVETGEEVIARVSHGPDRYDVIFLDLNLPGRDGLGVMRELEPYFRGHVILLSGEEERVLEWSRKVGLASRLNVAGYLRKPVKRAVLADRLSEIGQDSAAS